MIECHICGSAINWSARKVSDIDGDRLYLDCAYGAGTVDECAGFKVVVFTYEMEIH